MSRDLFLEQIEDAKGCGRGGAIGWRRGHDYRHRYMTAEQIAAEDFDAGVRQRVAMLIGSGDPLHELLQDAAARLRLNMKPRAL
jgi:hypothetical protein